MNTAVVRAEDTPAAIMEKVVIGGDLSKLEPAERLQYYANVCKSVGLNPLTQPFEYINLNGKLRLYAKRDATDQLRKIHGISIRIAGRDLVGEIYVVTAQATDKAGREDESTGAVNIIGKKGDDLANAYMKAETKAKRRVTLSIAGLGLLDESELEDVDPEAPAAHAEPKPVVGMPKALSDSQVEPKKEIDLSKKINAGQLKLLQRKLEGANAEAFCKEFAIAELAELPFGKINDGLKWISEHTPE